MSEIQTFPSYPPKGPLTEVSQLHELRTWFDGARQMFDGHVPPGGKADTAQRHDNTRRAGFAAAALVAYAVRTRMWVPDGHNDEEPATVLKDLLNDLRHLADALVDTDFDQVNEGARRSYDDELEGRF